MTRELVNVLDPATRRHIGEVLWPIDNYGQIQGGIPGSYRALGDCLKVPSNHLTVVPGWDGNRVWYGGYVVALLERRVRAEEPATGSNGEPSCPRCGHRGVFVRTALMCPDHDVLLGGF